MKKIFISLIFLIILTACVSTRYSYYPVSSYGIKKVWGNPVAPFFHKHRKREPLSRELAVERGHLLRGAICILIGLAGS